MTLHALASRLVKQMYERYGICTPEANGAPILWRVIEGLGGTRASPFGVCSLKGLMTDGPCVDAAMLYVLTKAMSDTLSLPLTLHPSLAAPLSRAGKRDPIRYQYDNVPAEVAYACAAVVVLKMVYGLDGQARCVGELRLYGYVTYTCPCLDDADGRKMRDVCYQGWKTTWPN